MTVAAATNPAVKRVQENWPWYVIRASGMVAAVLLLLLILSGVGLLTGYTYKILEPLPAWAAHRALGLSFGVMTIVHIFFLLFDKYIGFTLADLLMPFRSVYKPLTIGSLHVGSLYVAMGIFAFYGIIIVILTSLLWINKKQRPWRVLHYLSYAILLLVFLHALYLGTDIKVGYVKVLWFVGGVIITVSIIQRLWRAKTISKTQESHPNRPVDRNPGTSAGQ